MHEVGALRAGRRLGDLRQIGAQGLDGRVHPAAHRRVLQVVVEELPEVVDPGGEGVVVGIRQPEQVGHHQAREVPKDVQVLRLEVAVEQPLHGGADERPHVLDGAGGEGLGDQAADAPMRPAVQAAKHLAGPLGDDRVGPAMALGQVRRVECPVAKDVLHAVPVENPQGPVGVAGHRGGGPGCTQLAAQVLPDLGTRQVDDGQRLAFGGNGHGLLL